MHHGCWVLWFTVLIILWNTTQMHPEFTRLVAPCVFSLTIRLYKIWNEWWGQIPFLLFFVSKIHIPKFAYSIQSPPPPFFFLPTRGGIKKKILHSAASNNMSGKLWKWEPGKSYQQTEFGRMTFSTSKLVKMTPFLK